jgi:hypothetical protein
VAPFRVRVVVAAVATATAVSVGTVVGFGTVAAAEPSTESAVASYLAEHPGGTQISDREISYASGAFVVTVVAPLGALARPDCPAGWFCFYDRVNYGYPRGQLSDCGWQDLAPYGWHNRTDSVHVNSVGTVAFITHSGTGHGGDATAFTVKGVGANPDVGANRNRVDHVYRFC